MFRSTPSKNSFENVLKNAGLSCRQLLTWKGDPNLTLAFDDMMSRGNFCESWPCH